jgi:hypothetical protein
LSLPFELLFGFDLSPQHRKFHMQFLTATAALQGDEQCTDEKAEHQCDRNEK